MWTYSGDPGNSDLDEVRFYVQDTDKNDPLLSDEEIQYVIDTWSAVYGSNIMHAAVCAEILAAKFAREVTYSADGVAVGANELQQKYNDLAASLRDTYKNMNIAGGPDVGGILYGETLDSGIKPLIWSVGMGDNRRAGQQDYGGELGIPVIPEIGGSYP